MRSPIIGVVVPCPADERRPRRASQDVLAALRARGRRVCAIPADPDLLGALRREGVGLALLALEGRDGDDGAVHAALEAAGVAHTGPAAPDAALAGDLARAREVLRRSGLPTPPCYRLPPGLAADRVRELHGDLGYPVLVRSPRRASPLAPAHAFDAEALAAACARADGERLIERVTPGVRIRIALLDGRPLGAELVRAFRAAHPDAPAARGLDRDPRAAHPDAPAARDLDRDPRAAHPDAPAARGLDRDPRAAPREAVPVSGLDRESRPRRLDPHRAARWQAGAAARSPVEAPSPAQVIGVRRLEGILRQASAAARALRLAGPALVEIALHPETNEVVLDADPFPGLARGAPLARIAGAAGLLFEELIDAIASGAAPIGQPLAA